MTPGTRWTQSRGQQIFFQKKTAPERNPSVHLLVGWGMRWWPVVALPLLIWSGMILPSGWLVEGRSSEVSTPDDPGRDSGTGFTTLPQQTVWRVRRQVITGQVALTLLEANPEDDTLRVNLRVSEVRSSRDDSSAGQSERVSPTFAQEVRAHWQKGTSCPTLQLRIPAVELPTESAPLPIPSFLVRIEETGTEVPQLLCSWTRQINAGRSRLGILRALNRSLLPPAEVSLTPEIPSPRVDR